ncbi:hypothetical protein [Burkholderia diffusa]|uniref:hypothetical protein n=1 Tax=Burkholderia diffusa TaxID=488732 RepID=UPI00158D4E69|nr:hypothetical protein [Burkholderia diffusa]
MLATNLLDGSVWPDGDLAALCLAVLATPGYRLRQPLRWHWKNYYQQKQKS